MEISGGKSRKKIEHKSHLWRHSRTHPAQSPTGNGARMCNLTQFHKQKTMQSKILRSQEDTVSHQVAVGLTDTRCETT